MTVSREIINEVRRVLGESDLFDVEYVEIVDPDEMTEVENVRNGALLALAGRFGKTRLIDNIIL